MHPPEDPEADSVILGPVMDTIPGADHPVAVTDNQLRISMIMNATGQSSPIR